MGVPFIHVKKNWANRNLVVKRTAVKGHILSRRKEWTGWKFYTKEGRKRRRNFSDKRADTARENCLE